MNTSVPLEQLGRKQILVNILENNIILPIYLQAGKA
jgi:hypothetical protein